MLQTVIRIQHSAVICSLNGPQPRGIAQHTEMTPKFQMCNFTHTFSHSIPALMEALRASKTGALTNGASPALVNAARLTPSVNTNHGLKLTPKLTSTLIALSMGTVIHTLMQFQIDCRWQQELLTTGTEGNGEGADPRLPPGSSEQRGANARGSCCWGEGAFQALFGRFCNSWRSTAHRSTDYPELEGIIQSNSQPCTDTPTILSLRASSKHSWSFGSLDHSLGSLFTTL